MELSDLKQLRGIALLSWLFDNKILQPLGSFQGLTIGFVMRLSQLAPGSIALTAAKASLIGSLAGSTTESTVRRMGQRVSTELDSGGDKSREYIWISEADDNTCTPCISNSARIHTLEEWEELGLPGAETCDGGDRCRCDLFPVG